YVSTTCGKYWSLRRTLTGANLATAPRTSSSFTPSSLSDWRLEGVSLGSVSNKPNIRIKFKFNSFADNNIYIDDINLLATPTGVTENPALDAGLDVYPNPAGDAFHIAFDLRKSEHAEVRIM